MQRSSGTSGASAVRDAYGFLLDDDTAVENNLAAAAHEMDVLPRQRKAWADLAKQDNMSEAVSAARKKSAKFKAMIRGGIPDELRKDVWPVLCGANKVKRSLNDPEYYQKRLHEVDAKEKADLAARAAEEGARKAGDPPRSTWDLLDTCEQIDKDLGRTFPSHSLIATPEGQASLRRLLRAYCAGRNPHTGYCQGMNFLGAMLLCVMAAGPANGQASSTGYASPAGPVEEEAAFWMLVVLVERLLPADYFTDGLTGVRVDSEILLDLMRERLPALHAHFNECGALPLLPMVTTQWFISLFVYWLPTRGLLRLWDCFFADGLKSKNKTFFRAALTLFKLHETSLQSVTDTQEMMDALKTMAKQNLDADALVHELYNKQWLVTKQRI